MRALFKPAAVLVCTAVLAGCGGGGSDAPAAGSPPPGAPPAAPPPAPAQINSSTYLNAYWLGLVGVQRLETVGEIIDVMFSAFLERGDTPGPVSCSGGGSVTLSKPGTSRTMTVDAAGCVEGSVTLLAGGTVTSPNAVFGGIGTVVLQSGTFQFTNVGYKTVRDPTNGTDVLSGSVTLSQRNPITSTPGYDATGSVSVVRNGKTDDYTNIAVVTTAGSSTNAISLVSGAYDLTTPRFSAKLSLTGNLTTNVLTATSADGSNVQGVEASPSTSPPTRTYTVRTTAGGAAVLTQTLVDNDSSVQAALLNALN